MSLESAVMSARVASESLMTATCEIRRPGGTPGAFNPASGQSTSTPYAAHFTGPCRVKVLSVQDQESLVAEQQVTSVGYRVSLKWDAAVEVPGLSVVGFLVTVTDVGPIGDPALAGRVLVVRSVARGSVHRQTNLVCTADLG